MAEEEKQLFSAEGYVRSLIIDNQPTYTIYKFKISKTPNGEVGRIFSGFKLEGIKNGQLVNFKWYKKGNYNNVENFTWVGQENLTNVTERDKVTPLMDELLPQYCRLHSCAVEMCMRNNTLSNEEITAQFIRLQKVAGLIPVFMEVEKFIKEKYKK